MLLLHDCHEGIILQYRQICLTVKQVPINNNIIVDVTSLASYFSQNIFLCNTPPNCDFPLLVDTHNCLKPKVIFTFLWLMIWLSLIATTADIPLSKPGKQRGRDELYCQILSEKLVTNQIFFVFGCFVAICLRMYSCFRGVVNVSGCALDYYI